MAERSPCGTQGPWEAEDRREDEAEDEDEAKVVVWVFQMTIARNHDGKTSGFTKLKTLVPRLKEKFNVKQVEFKYVIVVPYGQDVAVRWHMLLGWKDPEVRGDVFVLYLDSNARWKLTWSA